MSKLESIKGKILELEAGIFQNLCNAYLSRIGYPNIVALGSQAGTNKTTPGTPDTYFPNNNDKYIFVEYSVQQDSIFNKLSDDIDKCLDEEKTHIPISSISEIICCFTSSNLYSEADKYQSILSEIIHTLHNHTFAVELSARLLEIGILSPQALSDKLIAEKASMNDPDKISVKKDGRSKKATYYNHIHTLFSLYQLSEAEKAIMRNLALAPRSGILAKLIAIWLELDNLNIINDLIEKGFIEARAGRTILLHPMIQEITVDETKPSVSNCSTLLRSVQNTCLLHGEDIMYYKNKLNYIHI